MLLSYSNELQFEGCNKVTVTVTMCFSVEEIHSVGTISNVETSYFTQLKMCCLMTAFRCPSDILITY